MTPQERALEAFHKEWEQWEKQFPEAIKYRHTAREWFMQGYLTRDAAKEG